MLYSTREKRTKGIRSSIWSGKIYLVRNALLRWGKKGKKRNPAREFLVG